MNTSPALLIRILHIPTPIGGLSASGVSCNAQLALQLKQGRSTALVACSGYCLQWCQAGFSWRVAVRLRSGRLGLVKQKHGNFSKVGWRTMLNQGMCALAMRKSLEDFARPPSEEEPARSQWEEVGSI